MKKLLLTLLGAAALCGLSPHAAAEEPSTANVLHMDFNKRTADHNQDLHFYGKLQTLTSTSETTAATVCTFYNPDTRVEWPTATAGLSPTPDRSTPPKYTYKSNGSEQLPAYNSASDYDGVKYIENDQLKIELNYRWALAKNVSNNVIKIHYTSQIRVTADEGGLYLYPGVTFKISAKNGKKIKKIKLKTPYNASFFDATRRKANLYVYQTPEDDNFSEVTTLDTSSNATTIQKTATVTDGTYEYNNGENTLSRATIEITLPETYPGENSDIVLGLKKDGLLPWNYQDSQAKYKFSAITKTNISTLREPFGISAIDVEYYTDDELPKFIKTLKVGKDAGDQIKIKQGDNYIDLSEFTETSTSDEVVYLKLGDAFIKVNRTASSPSGKPTVTFDKTKGWIGVHAYSTIRAWLDPDRYQYKGQNAASTTTLPYKITYIVNGNVGKTTTTVASQSRINTGSNTSLLTGENKFENTSSNLKSNEICYIKNLNGIPSDLRLIASTAAGTWGVPTSQATQPSNISGQSGSVKSGTMPALVFDGLEFIYPSDAPNAPLSPTYSAGITGTEPGVYKSTTPFNLSIAYQKDEYDNHTIEYMVSDTKLDNDAIDWSKATSSADVVKIEIASSKFVYARTASTYEGETYYSSPVEITATILQPDVKIADLADLHKPENDGKVVLLQMPLMVTNNTSVYPQSQANGYTQVVYLRDINGIGVKAISHRKASTDPSFPGKSYDQESPTTDKVILMPENTVAGLYRYNDGKNPCIVIRDMTSEPATDYYDYQGNTTVEITNAAPYKDLTLTEAKRYPTDGEYTIITPDLYGKRFFIRGLDKWNGTDKSFNVAAADEDNPLKTIRLRIGSTTQGALGTLATLPTIESSKIYDIQGILEYDPEGNDGQGEYYLAPINIYEQFDIPKLIGPETIKDKIKEIYDETDPTKVVGYEYTDDFKDGLINLELKMEKPTTGTTPYHYYWSIVKEDGSSLCTSGHQGISVTTYKTNTNPQQLDLTTSKLTFDQETGSATIYAYCYESGNFNTTNSGRRLKIVIRDAVQSGPEVGSIEEFRSKMQQGELNADNYVKFNGRFAVVAKNGNILQLRDVDKALPLNPANASDTVTVFKDSYILIHDDDEWNYTYTSATSRTGFPVIYQSTGQYGWQAYAKKVEVGEEISKFIGKVAVDEAGNYDVDLTGFGTYFSASALYLYLNDGHFSDLDKVAVPGFDRATPRFIPYMISRDSDGKPVRDENGQPIMREENCVNRPVAVALSDFEEHPESHPETIELTDALLDAEMKVMRVQVEKAADADDYTARFTADGVALLWDMFGTDQMPSEPSAAALDDEPGDNTAEPAKSVKQQLADHMAAGTEHFNVTGILRKHTDGKYALQVEKIEPTPVDKSARFFADGEEIDGNAYEFVKRVDLTTDTPEGAVIKMTVGDGQQQAYDAEALKAIDADTKVTIERWVPGLLKGQPASVTLTKLSTDVSTLAEMAQGTNAKDLYHFRKHLKVIAADGEGTVMAADAAGRIALIAGAPAAIEAGKYITDVVLDRKGDYTAAVHADETVAPLDEEDEYAIATPEAVTVSAIDPAAHTGKAVTLFGAAIADGKAVENEGQGASYAIDPTFKAIPADEAEGWKLTGYILPGADSKPVIYLTAAEAVGRVALPVITPAEAAFLDKTTVTVTCATTGAAIEYSTDGGKTWTAYSEPFEVEATGDILARATAAGMLPSRQAKASVVREYLSGDVTITVDEQNGKTVITITGPGKIYYSIDGGAEKQYDGAITIANDTQTELSGTISAYALEEGKRPGAAKEASYKVSGISGIGADGEADGVRVEGNTITVPEGAQTFDIAGRRVNPQGLPRGIYIVRLASGKAVKVVIR